MTIAAVEAPDIHLLRGMLDTMTDHVFLLRLEGARYRLVYCNQAMAGFMGQPQTTLCGQFLDDILGDAPLYDRIAANYQRALDAGHVMRYEETTDGFQPAPLTIFDTRISPLADSTGEIRYICGISRDITARRQAEIALEHSNRALQDQLSETQRLHERLQEEAIRDPLTNLFNRRYFLESLKRELYRAQREGFPVTLMMVDIDHFKPLNDDHGHGVGDRVLQMFSTRLMNDMRAEDVICRWGGEEFLVMMPGLASDAARKRIEAWQVRHRPMVITLDDQPLEVRFSAGLATAPEHGTTTDTLINAADTALYRAKAGGRDQIRLFESEA